MGAANELCFVHREVLQQERSKESIFSVVQQVLHMQGIDTILRVTWTTRLDIKQVWVLWVR